jgi:Homeodomain-like domain-containing protein
MTTRFSSQVEREKLPLDKDWKKNLESHRVVDLLPDRRAETAARWMYHQPDLAVISRDPGRRIRLCSARRRSPGHSMLHMVKNLTEAVQVLLARCQAEILAEKKPDEPCQEKQNKPIISIEAWRPPEPAHVEKVRLARRAGRYARYQQVVELSKQGIATKVIADRVGMSDRTVRDWRVSGSLSRSPKKTQEAKFF